jgi:hypothetical protein
MLEGEFPKSKFKLIPSFYEHLDFSTPWRRLEQA